MVSFNSVAQAYVNQKKLDTETKILQNNATHFARQTVQWLKLIEDFNTSLKVNDYILEYIVYIIVILEEYVNERVIPEDQCTNRL